MFKRKPKVTISLSAEIGKVAFTQTANEVLGIDFVAPGSDLSPAFNSFAVQIRLMRNPREKTAFYEAYQRNFETIKQKYLIQNPDRYYNEFLLGRLKMEWIDENEYIVYPTIGTDIKDIIKLSKEFLAYYKVKKTNVELISFDFNSIRITVAEDSVVEELIAHYNKTRKIKTYE